MEHDYKAALDAIHGIEIEKFPPIMRGIDYKHFETIRHALRSMQDHERRDISTKKITAKDLAEITKNIIDDRRGEDAAIIRSVCMFFALELAVRGFAETSKIDERERK